MKINMRLASYLLIIFSLLGYVLSIQILYISANVKTTSTWLEDASNQLELIKETVNETLKVLQNASFLLNKQAALLNTTSELAQSFHVILTNEKIDETLNSANKTLYEVIARLDAISNLTSPEIAKEIRAAKNSISTLAQNFSNFTLFINSIRQNMTDIINNALKDLNALRFYIKEMQTKIKNLENYFNQTLSTIDIWISRSKIMKEHMKSVEHLLYTIIIYLIGLNTALLLTGIAFHKQIY